MVLGWRRAFCTSVPREGDSTSMASMDEIECEHVVDDVNSCSSTPKFGRRFGFFSSYSNPSTPPLRSQSMSSPSLRCRTTAAVPAPSSSVPVSPKLKCETKNSPRCFIRSSNPSSPRSSSPLSFLRSSLRLCTRRCGLCLQSLKRGQGMATFTAECSHCFHFPCIADHVKKQGSLACPVCSCLWKDMPLLSVDDVNQKHQFVEEEERIREKLATRFFTEDAVRKNESSKQQPLRSDLKVYNDDEPLASLTPKARFIPIPESDETCDEESIDEFQGFYVNGGNSNPVDDHATDVDVQLLPEAAIIATSRRHETYAIVLRVKAPPAPEKTQRRAPIDLVTVVDVSGKMTSEKLQIIKRAMRSIVSSLSSKDRLSIVAFSSYSKRLLPLRRMTTTGRRAARRIVDSMAVLAGSSNSKDAVKKAIKVLEDRREKNPVASIILLSEVVDQTPSISSTRYSHSRLDIPIHSLKLAVTEDHVFTKCIGDLFKVVVQDLKLQLGFISGSAPAAIAAVYSRTPQPIVLGSSAVQIGELSADEERELLVELKVPSSSLRSHQILSVRCCYRESTTQEIIYGRQQALLVPRPNTVRSSSPAIQRLRNLFITTRALAESKRLSDRNDITGAYHMLLSARALMHQSNSAANEFMVGLEAEISDLQRRRKAQSPAQEAGRRGRADVAAYTDEKGEPLTPTSAWRVADRLAKVAMLRKSVNRVSDLHGFEDARF